MNGSTVLGAAVRVVDVGRGAEVIAEATVVDGAAGVPGAEKYDGAWIAKSVRQAACPEIFADRVEDTIVKRILAARMGTKRSIRAAAAQARARRKARRRR